jgi:hypothetical protein
LQPVIPILTGASGAGKTTLTRAVEAEGRPGVGCFYFDSIGVPSLAMMQRDFGGPEAWQAAMTHQWVHRLACTTSGLRLALLDAQSRPTFIRAAFEAEAVRDGHIVLIDCSPEERHARLRGSRNQPELATVTMDSWAPYLRGQADALGIPVLDTTGRTPGEATKELLTIVDGLSMRRAPELGSS